MRSLLPFLLLLVGCAPGLERPPSPNLDQPTVLSVQPSPVTRLPLDAEVRLLFSRDLDETTLEDSIGLLKGELMPSEVEELVLDEALPETVPVSLTLERGREVVVHADESLEPESYYSLVVTHRLLSTERLPFSQDPVSGLVPFVATYQSTGEGPIASETASEPRAIDSTSPPVAPPPMAPVGGGSPSVDPGPSTLMSVVINEVFYDAAGSDTDGLLFVELYGTAGMDLEGYRIVFINGDSGTETDAVVLPEGARVGEDYFYVVADSRDGDPTLTQVFGADLVDNFDPQNGPDTVILEDSSGTVVDRLGYGDLSAGVRYADGALFEGVPAPDVAGGRSLERNVPGQDTANNAVDFVERSTPTPRESS